VTNHKHPFSKFCQWYCTKLAVIKLPILTFHGGDDFPNEMKVKWMPYCAKCALHRLARPYPYSVTKMFKAEIKPLQLATELLPYKELESFEGYSIAGDIYHE
jgi:hypothetical protein